MHTDHNLRVVARTAELTADVDDPDPDDDDDDAWRFGGVAVGEGDILHTDDGTPVVFTADVLAEAAHTQAGEPLSKNHPADDEGNPVYPPPVEETAGTVEKAGYVPGKGLVYEARTHDETIAEGVKAGSFDVSVHPTFDLGEKDPETGAYIPENVEFLDLATVSKGMSASNTAEWGPNQALASWTRDADIGAEIEAHSDGTSDGDPPGWFRRWTDRMGLTAGGEGEQTADEPAESGADGDSQTQSMEDDTREQYVEFITANGDFDEESLEAMDDGTLETTHELVAEAATDGGDGDGDEDGDELDEDGDASGDGDGTEGDMSAVMDRLDEIEERMVTKDDAGEFYEEAEAQKDKREKVDEIIEASDDYDEDDREELMSSADSLIEQTHDRLTGTSGARLPGSASARSNVTASAGADDEDLDAYGTGLQE